MQIRRLRVPWYADRSDAPLTAQTKTQHHDQRQCKAVRSQLHRLPAIRLIPQLPAVAVSTQTAHCLGMTEQNLPRQHPKPVKQANESPEQARPQGNGKHKQGTQSECLGQQIRRQQLP